MVRAGPFWFADAAGGGRELARVGTGQLLLRFRRDATLRLRLLLLLGDEAWCWGWRDGRFFIRGGFGLREIRLGRKRTGQAVDEGLLL